MRLVFRYELGSVVGPTSAAMREMFFPQKFQRLHFSKMEMSQTEKLEWVGLGGEGSKQVQLRHTGQQRNSLSLLSSRDSFEAVTASDRLPDTRLGCFYTDTGE